MAPSRGKGKLKATADVPASTSTPRRTLRKSKNGVQDVYQDMLAEAATNEPSTDISERPLKRRKVASKASPPSAQKTNDEGVKHANADKPPSNLQVIDASSDHEDDSDESEFDFEDVDLEQNADSSPRQGQQGDDGIQDVMVSVDPATTSKQRSIQSKRRPISAAQKAFRIMVHKLHVLCLLGHCIYINGWCNNADVQSYLKSVLSKKTLSYLKFNRNDSQFQQNRSFMDGLQQASEAFRGQFKIMASGLRRPKWLAEDEGEALEPDTEPVDRSGFISAAKEMEGSQDTANQLFCALLRSAGVDARLVCSLQPLPFANVPSKSEDTPHKISKPTVYAMASGTDSAASDSNNEDASVSTSAAVGKVPSVRRRLGQPTFTSEPALARTLPKKKKPIRKLSYPIFWVEAFNKAHQKWISVDPTVTQTIGKTFKLEPPSSYTLNQLSYVLAFEADGSARDVTRRYTRAYNAKTRRERVESTENGDRWLRKALRIFRRRHATSAQTDRNQVEDAELAAKEAKEGLPANVQDFKNHPYYALERHLKRHEVIYPERAVGKVNAGTAAKPRMEHVYRRKDVLQCKSADKWYRAGRVVQEGVQPLKHVPAARRIRPRGSDEEEEDGGEVLTSLYAAFQTELYIPTPVSPNGRVPRNAFGNLDIYVPSMVPAGGTHIRHALAQHAARTLKIDYADAVTGFQFKGRQGTAVIEGVVVAERYAEAVLAVIEGLEEERVEEESKGRSLLALKVWRRFLVGLRIRERVAGYGEGGEEEREEKRLDEMVKDGEGGGFLIGGGDGGEALMPTAGRFSLDELMVTGKIAKSSKTKKMKESEEADLTSEDESSTPQDRNEYERPSTRPRRGRQAIIDDESDKDEHMPDHGNGGDIDIDEHVAEDPHEGFAAHDSHGGGGFLPEDAVVQDQGGGGGFLVEDSELHEEETHGLSRTDGTLEDSSSAAESDDRIGGYLNEETHSVGELMIDDLIPKHQGEDTKLSSEARISHETLPEGERKRSYFQLYVDELAHFPERTKYIRDDPNNGPSDWVKFPHFKERLEDLNTQFRKSTGPESSSDAVVTAGNDRDSERTRNTRGVTSTRSGDQFLQVDQTNEADSGDGDTAQHSVTAATDVLDKIPEEIEEDGQSDPGSMLSHDPDDEDAEPDWLESD